MHDKEHKQGTRNESNKKKKKKKKKNEEVGGFSYLKTCMCVYDYSNSNSIFFSIYI